jgi:hypothetical protein
MKTDKFIVEKVDQCPDKHEPGVLYVAMDNGKPFFSEALCPCGCGEMFHLIFNQGETPSWIINIDEQNLPDISPSVLKTNGCRSHFFIKKGAIQWV